MGKKVVSFALPYGGGRNDYIVLKNLRLTGYKISGTSAGGLWQYRKYPFDIKRYCALENTTVEKLHRFMNPKSTR